MEILILGSGAREVAIVKNILRNTCKFLNTNDNTINIYYTDVKENIQLNKLCKKYINLNQLIKRNTAFNDPLNDFLEKINYIIVGPEKYLGNFVNEKIFKNKLNVPVFGPNQCAILENSKSYTRNFIQLLDNNFNPEFEIINNKHNDINDEYIKRILLDYLEKYGGFVIKPDGLTGGKGVKLYPDNFDNIFECIEYCKIQDVFIIEEKLVGEEFSLMCFTDGNTCKFMPIVQDYKRAFDYDKGPNTGSMGSICDNINNQHRLWFLNETDITACQNIMEKTIKKINNNLGEKYKGVLYGSFIKINNTNDINNTNNINDINDINNTKDTNKANLSVKLIEYNCRLGDPEAINVLSLLNTSFLDIVIKSEQECLHELNLEWENICNLLVYITPKGYPLFSNTDTNTDTDTNSNLDSETNPYITLDLDNNNIYVASLSKILSNTDIKDKETNINLYKPNCSRTYAILFQDVSLQLCKNQSIEYFKESNNLLDKININVLRFRSDIGNKYLELKSKNIYTVTGGVDTVGVGNALNSVKSNILSTYNENMVSNFGSFSGEFKFKDSTLMASTDGVGTKSILLTKVLGLEGFNVMGQDLVNHNINDILVNGGYPLFFLDYYGCNNFKEDEFSYFIDGIAKSCRFYNTVLFGGETAVMKDIYRENECDFVGTIVGYKKFNFLQNYDKDDVLIGVPSSGFHTNGYSLLRQIYKDSMIEGIHKPHKCYLPLVESLIKEGVNIKSISHITGGGFYDNIDRVISRENYNLNVNYFEFPKYYKDVLHHYTKEECLNLFNCGYGLVIITCIDNLSKIQKYEPLSKIIGNVIKM